MPKDATSSGGPPGSTSPGVLSGNVVTTPQLSQGVSPSPQAGSPSVGSGNGATTVFVTAQVLSEAGWTIRRHAVRACWSSASR
jgi:hypothetical protein